MPEGRRIFTNGWKFSAARSTFSSSSPTVQILENHLKNMQLPPLQKTKVSLDLKDLKDQVSMFCDLMNRGVELWVAAGELLVKMVDQNPNAYSIIQREFPHVSIDTLLAFERIGRKEIFPYLLLDGSPGARKLVALPYDVQNKYYKQPVKVLVGWRNGKPLVEDKTVTQMSKFEADRAFSSRGLRTVDEQIDLLPKPTFKPSRTGDYIPKDKLVSVGSFRFIPDSRGHPTLQRLQRESLVAPLRLEITDDGSGGYGSQPFEIFRPQTKDEKTGNDEPEEKRTLNVVLSEQIEDMESDLKEAEELCKNLPENSPDRKLGERDIERLKKQIETKKILL